MVLNSWGRRCPSETPRSASFVRRRFEGRDEGACALVVRNDNFLVHDGRAHVNGRLAVVPLRDGLDALVLRSSEGLHGGGSVSAVWEGSFEKVSGCDLLEEQSSLSFGFAVESGRSGLAEDRGSNSSGGCGEVGAGCDSGGGERGR